MKVYLMKLNRRHFFSLSLVATVSAVYYFKGKKVTLFDDKTQIILATAYHLYPVSALGFGIKELNLASYLAFVLADERIAKEDRDYLLRGGVWIEEEAIKDYKKSFLRLTKSDKERLLQKFITFEWGENYINYLFTYIFEAIFSAPIYGSNIEKIGWQWSGHNPGFPQPKKAENIIYE